MSDTVWGFELNLIIVREWLWVEPQDSSRMSNCVGQCTVTSGMLDGLESWYTEAVQCSKASSDRNG